MKLLFDQNLSDRLVNLLAAEFPDSKHVRHFSMQSAEDWEVWAFAASNGFAIASKDADFNQRALVQGPPPKVVWLRIGNASTDRIETILRKNLPDLETFDRDPIAGVLVLS